MQYKITYEVFMDDVRAWDTLYTYYGIFLCRSMHFECRVLSMQLRSTIHFTIFKYFLFTLPFFFFCSMVWCFCFMLICNYEILRPTNNYTKYNSLFRIENMNGEQARRILGTLGVSTYAALRWGRLLELNGEHTHTHTSWTKIIISSYEKQIEVFKLVV